MPSALILTNFEGKARAEKKTRFLGQSFQEVPQIAFYVCFFPSLRAVQNIWPTHSPFSDLGELEKIHLVNLKKGQIFRNFFENPTLPSKNPRSAPEKGHYNF